MRASCQLQAERYRQICIPLKPDLAEIYAGYREIAQAALARDAELTEKLVADQYERNVRRFIAALQAEAPVAFWIDDTQSRTGVGHRPPQREAGLKPAH
jgi:hypothetical protein